MLDELKKINEQHMEILVKNNLEHSVYFATAKKCESENWYYLNLQLKQ